MSQNERLQVYINGINTQIPVTWINFPGGEIHPRLADSPVILRDIKNVTIYAKLHASHDPMALLLLTDAVRRAYPNVPINLWCPYLPYARQDRVAVPGESLALKVMAEIINQCGFNRVYVWDVHSNVSLALIDRVVNIELHKLVPIDYVGKHMHTHNTVVVAPDSGAIHRAMDFYNWHGFSGFVRADKVRDPVTGNITGSKLLDEIPVGKDVIIIDDICDGGRTFIELAKVIDKHSPGSEISLLVTHGIFSNGTYDLFHHMEYIYTLNSFGDSVEDVKIIPAAVTPVTIDL